MARAAVPALGAGYLAALLAADHFASFHEQLALGALTWLVLAAALRRFPLERRVQALGVVVFATIGEIVGSLVWGVYSYRLGNLPMFVPPAHGIVFLSGLALRDVLQRHERALVWAAGLAAASWALLGLTVLPQRDVAGALAVPILLVFLRRSRSRSIYAGVFLVVAALELYGTAIGTWRWAAVVPGTGVPDGNPPSGAAAGYIWFDVMALLVGPWLLRYAGRRRRSAPTPSGSATTS